MAARQVYLNAAGKPVPSVTTILGRFKESGGLLFWAFKKGMENGLAGKGGAKLYDDTDAVDAGTIAHDMVEAHINGREMPPQPKGSPEAIAKGEAAFQTFLKWQSMTHLRLRHTEVSLVSERYQFGGRLDAIGVVGNELVLCDWKTSNSVYLDYTLQLAAYGLLWEEIYGLDTSHKMPLVGGFHLLRFAKEEGDFAHHHYPKLDQEKVAFLKLREAYDLVKQCEKRVK